jgi:hypothetical protein
VTGGAAGAGKSSFAVLIDQILAAVRPMYLAERLPLWRKRPPRPPGKTTPEHAWENFGRND